MEQAARGVYPCDSTRNGPLLRVILFRVTIVPPAFVDSELPLSLKPAPVQLVRVFVGRTEFLTPDMVRSIEGALKAKDQGALARYGRFAAPHVLSLLPGLTGPEQDFGYSALSNLFQKPDHCPPH